SILRLSPMLTLRDFHGICHQQGGYDVRPNGDTMTVAHDGHVVTLRCRGALVKQHAGGGQWWRDLTFPIDAERGQEDREDALVPGSFEIPIAGDTQVLLTVAL